MRPHDGHETYSCADQEEYEYKNKLLIENEKEECNARRLRVAHSAALEQVEGGVPQKVKILTGSFQK